MSRGKPINRSEWPGSGPVLDWLRYLDRIHRANGFRSQRDIAKRMGLSSPTRVGLLVGGRLPADTGQARSLLAALGALDDEITTGLRLHRKAAATADLPTATPTWWLRSGYLERVRDMAPRELLGRDAELDALATFCAGDVAYARWQAPARAGKTALFSWFALHPPPGTWVLSFFVTARLTGYADSTAYRDALLDQLAALTGETVPPDALAGARDRMWHQLLRIALQRAATAGHRLVILVDGLDEDRGVRPGSGLPSIASLLPKRPEPHLRVLVAGRPDPPLPADVDPDHPLRDAAIHDLPPSPHAREVALLAARELNEALAGPDRLNEQVLGLVTAAGGGLTGDDMQQLTGRARYELDALLHGVFGRTLAERDAVYLYTHETLREQAVDRFGPHKLAEYRCRLAEWARTYRDRGWPASTPPYLLRSYQLMLADAGDLPELATLATDRSRHDRMLATTGGDAAGLAEIAAAQHLVGQQPDPDLVIAARLAFHRDALTARNLAVPVRLPAVWARLGHQVRAEALAYSIPDGHRRALSLAALAEALAGCEHPGPARSAAEAALAAADTVTDRFRRAEALAAAARAAAAHGDRARAWEITGRIGNGYYHALALASVATVAARAGHLASGTALAREISHPVCRSEALTAVADHARSAATRAVLAREIPHPLHRAYALARADHLEEAETICSTWANDGPDLENHRSRADQNDRGGIDPRNGDDTPGSTGPVETSEPFALALAYTAMSTAAARSGDSHAAARHGRSAARAADHVRGWWQVSLAIADADTTGDHRCLDRAATRSRAIPDLDRRAQALAAVAEAAARHDRHDLATALAEEAGAAARGSVDLHARERQFWILTETVLSQGDLDRAERLVHAAPPSQQGAMFAELAAAHLRSGDLTRGRASIDAALTRDDRRPYRQNLALVKLPALLSGIDRAEAVRYCDRLTGETRVEATLALVAAVKDSDPALAARLVRTAAGIMQSAEVLAALAAIGDVDRAVALIASAPKDGSRHSAQLQILRAAPSGALAELIKDDMAEHGDPADFAEVLAGAGLMEHAEQLAGRAPGLRNRAIAHARMAKAAAVEHPVRAARWAAEAENLTDTITDEYDRDRARSHLAAAFAGLGDTIAVHRTITAIGSARQRIEAAFEIGSPDLIPVVDAAIAELDDLSEQDAAHAALARMSPEHAGKIRDGALRASALMTVAASAGPPRLAVEALNYAHWEHTVASLAAVASDAVTAIADDFLAAQRPEPVTGRADSQALVLVIEDDQDIAMILRLMLTRAGHKVEVRHHGRTGARAALEIRPDLVLTGIGLPGWDGRRVIKHIRRSSDVPIMVVTGLRAEPEQVYACRLGADAFLGKPFMTAALEATVENLLHRSDRPASWIYPPADRRRRSGRPR